VDEYVRISETTAMDCLKRFCEDIVLIYEDHYLREPNKEDVERLQKANAKRGFPGMLGSIDCMHWGWKNCPTAWAGQYKGKEGAPTVVLEAIASYDLHIWHAFFGTPGVCNDINILDRSPLFDQLIQGQAPPTNFTINGHDYGLGYFESRGPNYLISEDMQLARSWLDISQDPVIGADQKGPRLLGPCERPLA
jgi:hypothetical protein